jgi:hypothetical protein
MRRRFHLGMEGWGRKGQPKASHLIVTTWHWGRCPKWHSIPYIVQ